MTPSHKPGMDGETKKMTMVAAINDAIRVAMRTDETAVIFGEDVAFGGVWTPSVAHGPTQWPMRLLDNAGFSCEHGTT